MQEIWAKRIVGSLYDKITTFIHLRKLNLLC